MKVREAVKRLPRTSDIATFLDNHPDEVFTAQELAERMGVGAMKNARDKVPPGYVLKNAYRCWSLYGTPKALKEYDRLSAGRAT